MSTQNILLMSASDVKLMPHETWPNYFRAMIFKKHQKADRNVIPRSMIIPVMFIGLNIIYGLHKSVSKRFLSKF